VFKGLAVAILLVAFATDGVAQTTTPAPKPKPVPTTKKKPSKPPKPADTVVLSGIVEAVELVVDAYNTRPETQGPNPTLPPLKTADFDFKTVVDIKGGVSVNFLIFKFGHTYEQAETNDVSFQYVPKPIKPGGHFAIAQVQDLKDGLTKAIEGAVNQIKGEESSDKSPLKLQLKQLAVTLAFAVTGDYSGGLTIPIHMVTLGGTGDYSKSSTQTVKLTFSFPDKP
jgi:hypothetical protein